MGPDSVAIVVGAGLATRSADTDYPFRQDSDFWYLTGFAHPDAVLVLSTMKDAPPFTLFVQPRDPLMETWNGYRPGIEGAKADFEADSAFDCAELEKRLPDLWRGARQVHHQLGRNAAIDRLWIESQEQVRRQSKGGVHPSEALRDPRTLIHEMRLFKSEEELVLMRKAAAISAEAHLEAAKLARDGVYEYELEATLGFVFRRRGASGPAYGSIVGGGANATILHYVSNDQPLRQDQLVLIDAGCEYQGYASDVTRTYPVGGRYVGAARDVYDVVLAAQYASLDASAPGATLPDVHQAALRTLVSGMVDLKLLAGSVDALIESEAYKPYYMHGTSHWLGLDVHDVGIYATGETPRRLEPGMVFTVEPGLYVPADDEKAPEALRGIGVRIEDDVVVTQDGIENLNTAIPKKPAEVEAWIQNG